MAELLATVDGLPELKTAQPARAVQLWLREQELTLDELRSHRKDDPMLIEARQVVTVYLRRHGWSLPRIGRYLNRDHTTILHRLQKETSQ